MIHAERHRQKSLHMDSGVKTTVLFLLENIAKAKRVSWLQRSNEILNYLLLRNSMSAAECNKIVNVLDKKTNLC